MKHEIVKVSRVANWAALVILVCSATIPVVGEIIFYLTGTEHVRAPEVFQHISRRSVLWALWYLILLFALREILRSFRSARLYIDSFGFRCGRRNYFPWKDVVRVEQRPGLGDVPEARLLVVELVTGRTIFFQGIMNFDEVWELVYERWERQQQDPESRGIT
jgi:hypothetical protein